MSEINSKANLEYDFDSDIVKEEIKLEPYLDDIKSEFGDDIICNTEQKHNYNETNPNISQNSGRNTREETEIMESGAHEVYKRKVETADTVNPFDDEDLDIVKEEIKLEPYLDNIKSVFCDDIICNTEQKHNFNETNTNISQNLGRNRREETAIKESSAHETDKIKVETADAVDEDDQNKNVCEYRTVAKDKLKLHNMSNHTGEKPLACNLCEYKTVFKSLLTLHNMRSHTGEKPFACNLCEYRAVTKGLLKLHNMRSHTGEKPFACDLCEYRTVTKDKLITHMRSHTGEKPFACNLCEYRTATTCKLKLHNMRSHTGEKPFACNLCKYRTVTKDKLKLHNMSIHTGEKPFACNLCEYRTVAKNNLNKHIKIHSNEK